MVAKQKLFTSIFFILIVNTAFAIDWPSNTSQVEGNFGLNKEGRALVGLEFSGEEEVRSVSSGDVIFSTGDPFSFSSFTAPLGAWEALEHGDGMVSIYARLAPQKNIGRSRSVEKGSILAQSGKTGWSTRTNFYYALFDRIASRWVNPTLISNQRQDTGKPIIHQVLLIGRDGSAINPRTNPSVRQGAWRVHIETNDNENAQAPLKLGPHEISILVNGIEEQNLRFDYISAKEGNLIIPGNPPRTVDEVYTKEGLYDLGEIRLNRGRVAIQIIVRDSVGNERQVSYTIRVD